MMAIIKKHTSAFSADFEKNNGTQCVFGNDGQQTAESFGKEGRTGFFGGETFLCFRRGEAALSSLNVIWCCYSRTITMSQTSAATQKIL